MESEREIGSKMTRKNPLKGGTLIGIWVADWMRRLTNVDSGTEPMASNSIADSLLELSLLKYTAATFGSRVRAQNKLNISDADDEIWRRYFEFLK